MAFALGADGIFFMNSDDDDGVLQAVTKELRACWGDRLLGAGYATLGPAAALQRSLRDHLDATWTARRDITSEAASSDAVEASKILRGHRDHRVFASIGLPDHLEDPRPGVAAVRAQDLGMIPTTGAEKGPVPYRKLGMIRGAIGDSPLGLAAWGPTSLAALTTLPSHVFVSTAGMEGFQYLDPDLFRTCMGRVAEAVARTAAGPSNPWW
ncbi:hypothetical protein [Variovorax saccharolyticus]|uniref:hypothetical protein n=1 Tax=Variovorax saccharolyticus TaxID=3053516 RepID=UPI0025783638|nr:MULTISPECIES: hypothetical protein [unclassified Variovorax]MDM0022491.1 hypothetical protein [Variovorax sp. J22R187]MDM0028255.1 hypothetical protein [Variovorax sp. J31P216]